jgi:hypothetical protein
VTVENQKKYLPSFTRMYIVAGVLALGVFGVGLWLTAAGKDDGAAQSVGIALLAAGAASLVAVLLVWPLAIIHNHAHEEDNRRRDELNSRLQEISVVLNMVSEQQLLSDRAKAVAFREKDRDALRRAIRDEMHNKDWEAAKRLADDMEVEFGYKQEADRFREEIELSRNEVLRRQISDAVAVIDRHCRAELWQDALREADRLRTVFPNNEQILRLPQEIENRRQSHKKQLLDSWRDAVNRHDTDGSIEILKKLDLYLTPMEAESMQETARGVFKEKLHNLRTQFSIAVQDHKWPEAIKIGEQIAAEFPNTRVAQEVRETMDALKKRASEPETAKV